MKLDRKYNFTFRNFQTQPYKYSPHHIQSYNIVSTVGFITLSVFFYFQNPKRLYCQTIFIWVGTSFEVEKVWEDRYSSNIYGVQKGKGSPFSFSGSLKSRKTNFRLSMWTLYTEDECRTTGCELVCRWGSRTLPTF